MGGTLQDIRYCLRMLAKQPGSREVVLESREAGSGGAAVQVEYNEIAPRYFETLGVGLVRGQDFTAQDDARAPGVALVNETMARQLWAADVPLGKRLRFVQFMGMSAPFEIVGVVRDSRTFILDDRIRPEIYIPLEQGRRWNATVLIRARNGSVGIAAAVAQELRQLDPTLPPAPVESMAEHNASTSV